MAIIRISEKTEKKLDELALKFHRMKYNDISKDFLLQTLILELEKSSQTISNK